MLRVHERQPIEIHITYARTCNSFLNRIAALCIIFIYKSVSAVPVNDIILITRARAYYSSRNSWTMPILSLTLCPSLSLIVCIYTENVSCVSIFDKTIIIIIIVAAYIFMRLFRTCSPTRRIFRFDMIQRTNKITAIPTRLMTFLVFFFFAGH